MGPYHSIASCGPGTAWQVNKDFVHKSEINIRQHVRQLETTQKSKGSIATHS